jgi:hypothetical protein
MFKSPYLREIDALYREASRGVDEILAWNPDSRFWWERFHAVTKLGLGLSSQRKQQHRDANLLVVFALAYPEFPDSSDLRISAPDPPDFVVECDSQRTAIEITEIYTTSARCERPQGQEPLKENLVDEALRLYRASGKPSISAVFSFSNDTNYLKRDRLRLAQALQECVPTHLATNDDLVPVHAGQHGPQWVPGLDMILVRKPRPYEGPDHLWRIQYSGFVHPSETFIQQALDAKEQKLKKYRMANCDNYWLVTVVPGTAPSSFMDIPAATHVFKSSFDRVVVFFLQSKSVFVLHCDKPS